AARRAGMRATLWTLTCVVAAFAGTARAQSSASAFTTGYRFDAMQQLVGVIRPTAGGGYEALRNTYDAEGRTTKVERGYLTQWQSETTLPANWPGAQFVILEVTDSTYDVIGRLLTKKVSSNS